MFEFILLIKPKDNLNLQYTLHSTFMTIFFSELLGVIDKTLDVEFKSSLNHHNIGIDTSRLNKADLYQILASMKEVIVIFADIDKGVVLNINADRLVQYLSNSIDLSDREEVRMG